MKILFTSSQWQRIPCKGKVSRTSESRKLRQKCCSRQGYPQWAKGQSHQSVKYLRITRTWRKRSIGSWRSLVRMKSQSNLRRLCHETTVPWWHRGTTIERLGRACRMVRWVNWKDKITGPPEWGGQRGNLSDKRHPGSHHRIGQSSILRKDPWQRFIQASFGLWERSLNSM